MTSQNRKVNRRVLLASRPVGAPTADNFKMDEQPIPKPGEGEVLLRTLYLSLDPYMRGRMSDAASYAAPTPLGSVMGGGTVAIVEVSNNSSFAVGDLVESYVGWQDYGISNGKELVKLKGVELKHPSYAVGVMGMPGFTAYQGLIDIGNPQPGETVVVAAATGAVGSVVGQVAKLKGCHVVGIAGGPEKCKYAVEKLGFDKCIDHKSDNLKQQLQDACPKGIDVYFENVGGKVFEAVFPLLNTKARVPVCGLISAYNATSINHSEIALAQFQGAILKKRMRVQGFIIFQDYFIFYDEFKKVMGKWVEDGKIFFKEDVVEGLENSQNAFIGLLEGKNFGKLVIHVGDV
ncbi:hypothetical protein CYY_009309 [Polysphondylium violaceum]|uniref:Enoyl reductase (ER) domain-containing protein n=1 Tax=Polysphondylium violaceum TaxID=133409 RepID=A0A8J4UW62_9MYCE|nr:hypothetical protein CYY_009309 [Polysphondylium violaceum]